MMLLSHGVISAAGFLFANAEMVRKEDTQMLDDLDEGLLIYEMDDENGDQLLFQNQAALKLTQSR